MSEKPREHFEEESKQEQAKMPDDFVEPKEKERKIEEELSPEIIDMIMEKVQDINAEGTAFHVMKYHREGRTMDLSDVLKNFKSIVKDGIGGKKFRDWFYAKEIEKKHEVLDKWSKETMDTWRKINLDKEYYTNKPVFFNIIGRSSFSIRDSMYRGTTFIFDLKSFSEGIPIKNQSYDDIKKIERKSRKYFVQDSVTAKAWEERYGEKLPQEINLSNDPDFKKGTTSHRDFGFALFHRVSPRMLKGIIIDDSITNHEFENSGIASSQEVMNKRFKEFMIIMKNVYRGKKESLLLPVYDIKGNLMWPKHMNYEEVKKFVEERNKTEKGKKKK